MLIMAQEYFENTNEWEEWHTSLRLLERASVGITPKLDYTPRWKDECKECSTLTVWETFFIDQKGQSTSCITTQYHATIMPPVEDESVHTIYQTTTLVLPLVSSSAAPSDPFSPLNSQHALKNCPCGAAWLSGLLGGIPHGVGEVAA